MATQIEQMSVAHVPVDPEIEEKERVRKLIHLAGEQFKLSSEAENANRTKALDDFKFRTGDQWPADIVQDRVMDGRPCLTINRLPGFIRQITNEQRQQRPAIQVNPQGGGATKECAEILQGIIRHIEQLSNADVAYDTGFECMVTGGLGFWRIVTEYLENPENDPALWNAQELKIKRIKNPFTVYFDPSCVEPDYADANFCFIVEDLPVTVYKEKYKKSELAKLSNFTSVGDAIPGWAGQDTIRVAEWFQVVSTSENYVLLKNAQGEKRVEKESRVLETDTVIDRREITSRSIKWRLINAIEILEERTWEGKFIPVIPVIGDDLDIDGKRHIAGIVRDAKDPQRMYNYWVSASTEMIALAPKAPFVGAIGQFKSPQWAEANRRNLPYLEYNPIAIGGVPAPPPTRQAFEPPVQATNMMTRQADNDLKATTGIYDASLGSPGPDQSGKAILARQKQTDITNLNWTDNHSRSIRFTGRQLIDTIPKIYDAPRIQRIVKPDGTVDHVGVFNSAIVGDTNPEQSDMMTKAGIKKVYDLGVGIYDVTISVGPSYQSKRQESAASMMALVQAYPQIMQIAGDIIVGVQDWPGVEVIADRMKKTLPPNLQDGDNDDPEVQLQQASAKLNQLQQLNTELTKALNNASETIRSKKLEVDSRERIALITNQTNLMIAEAKLSSAEGMKVFEERLTDLRAEILNRLQAVTELNANGGLDLNPATPGAENAPQGIQQ